MHASNEPGVATGQPTNLDLPPGKHAHASPARRWPVAGKPEQPSNEAASGADAHRSHTTRTGHTTRAAPDGGMANHRSDDRFHRVRGNDRFHEFKLPVSGCRVLTILIESLQ